jgi:hypothetical protein
MTKVWKRSVKPKQIYPLIDHTYIETDFRQFIDHDHDLLIKVKIVLRTS